MINPMAKDNIEIELSDNKTFIIKVISQWDKIETKESVVSGTQSVISHIGFKQKMYTANTVDEAMILIREQIEKLLGLI